MQRIIVVVLGLLATLLGLPADQADPTQWGEVGILSLVVWGTVAYLRAHVLRDLEGIAVTIAAAVVGVGLAVALGAAQVITGTPFDWILFGVQATFFATIGDQALKRASGTSGKAVPAP